jgi:predicted anti-sigma-YlaC factor YlaD
MPAGFLTEVLKATSGAPCDKIEKWLVDEAWSAGTTRPWVREHLEDCSPCRSLEAALVELRRELPRLASLPVETGFTERVLRKTLPPRQRFARWSTSLWRRWLVRPRFASELAYVLTVVLIVLVGSPSAPLRALSETRDGRVTVEHLERDLQTAASTLGARVPKAELTAVWSFVEGTTRLVGESLDEGVEAVRGGWAGGLAFGKSLFRAIVDGDERPSG